ncbi:anoctamin-7-like [Ixodes scapularis]
MGLLRYLLVRYVVGSRVELDFVIREPAACADGRLFMQAGMYRDLRDANGNWTFFHWKLLAVRLAFVIIFEHVVFGVCRLIDVLVPDIASQLELKIKRERYLAKQALADSETIMKVAQRRDEEEEEEDVATSSEPPQAGTGV